MSTDAGRPLSTAELLDPSRTALIVWDMQQGVAGRAFDLEPLVDRVRFLISSARSARVDVIWSRHVAPPLTETTAPALRALMRRQKVDDPSLLRPIMQEGTPDVEFLPLVSPEPNELVLTKHTASFFIGTGLHELLRDRDAETLVLCGVATEQGIEFTARHAIALGYDVFIAEDAVSSFTRESHGLGMAYLRTACPVLMTGELSAAWGVGW